MIAALSTPFSAGQAYSLARSATAPGSTQAGAAQGLTGDRFTSGGGGGGLASAGDRFLAQLDGVDSAARAAMTGGGGPEQLVQTIAETEVALETVIAIRDRVIEAYQEILRMPV